MKWIAMVLLMVVCILMIIGYALLVMLQEEGERADRMYRKWKEERDERSR